MIIYAASTLFPHGKRNTPVEVEPVVETAEVVEEPKEVWYELPAQPKAEIVEDIQTSVVSSWKTKREKKKLPVAVKEVSENVDVNDPA